MIFPNLTEPLPQAQPTRFDPANAQEQAALDALMLARLVRDIDGARGLPWEPDARAARTDANAIRDPKTVAPLLHSVLRGLAGLHARLLVQLEASLRVVAGQRGSPVLSSEDLCQYSLVSWRLEHLQRARTDLQSAVAAAPRASGSGIDPIALATSCRTRALAGLKEELEHTGAAAASAVEAPVDLDARLSVPARWTTSLDLLEVADCLFARGVGASVWVRVVDAAAAAAPEATAPNATTKAPTQKRRGAPKARGRR